MPLVTEERLFVSRSSRIEYPGLIPHEGTLEFWINVNDGYHYENYHLRPSRMTR